MNHTRCAESFLQSSLITSIMLICIASSNDGIVSYMLEIYSTAFCIEQCARNTNAFRLQIASVSAMRKVCMSSGASGTRFSNSR